ncbi:MAG: cyclic nucleotide-binding domain-containing protein [Holophagales bacterium]|nr:cyclic nucleotide-binding domain-containing protein [Holophagales bacterium]
MPSGSRLLAAGESGEEAYVVAEGRLRVSVRIPGVGEEALAFLGPGEVVGEMSLVDDSPRSADVVAQDGPVTVFALPREVFQKILAEGTPEGAPLLGGIVVALVRRFEESVRKAATFRVLAGPF